MDVSFISQNDDFTVFVLCSVDYGEFTSDGLENKRCEALVGCERVCFHLEGLHLGLLSLHRSFRTSSVSL